MENTGLCYSCRHISPTMAHCHGTGHLEPTLREIRPWPSDPSGTVWPGFTCVCPCTRPEVASSREA